jgi:hypothetical protein
MARTVLGSAVLELSANIASLQADMDKASRVISSKMNTWERQAKRVTGFFKGMGAGLLGGFSLSGFAAITKQLSDFADSFEEAASRTGVLGDTLEALSAKTKEFGGSSESALKSIDYFAAVLGKAQTEGGSAAKVFEQFGVSIKNTDGTLRSVQSVLDDTAKRFRELNNPAFEASIGRALFGREGSRSVVMAMNDVEGGLDAITKSMTEQGRVMGDTTRKQLKDFGDQWGILIDRFNVAIAVTLGPLVSKLNEIATFFNQMGQKTMPQIFNQFLVWLGEIGNKLAYVIPGFAQINTFFGMTGGGAGGMTGTMDDYINGLKTGADVAQELSDTVQEVNSRLRFGSDKAREGWTKTSKELRREIDRFVSDAKRAGIEFTITSTWRDSGRKGSKHRTGNAVDLVASNWKEATRWWQENAHKYSLTFPVRTERPGDQAGTTFGTGPHWHAQLEQTQKAAGANKELAAAARDAAAAEREQQRVMDEAAQIRARTNEQIAQSRDNFEALLATMDPVLAATREFDQAMRVVDEAFSLGTITLEEYLDAADRLRARMEEVGQTSETLAATIQERMGQAMGSWIDSAMQGTFKLKDALKDLLQTIVKAVAKMALLKAAESAGGGSFWGQVLGNVAGAFQHGGRFNQLALAQGVYNQPTFFPMGPGAGLTRFAKGGGLGLLGEMGAEAILPLTRRSNGDLGVKAEPANVNVSVTNNVGEYGQASVQRSVNGDIEVVINRIQSDIARGGNPTANAFERAYGLNRGR